MPDTLQVGIKLCAGLPQRGGARLRPVQAARRKRGAALTSADIKRLPDISAKPRAILWDKEKNLLFVPEPAATNTGRGKIVRHFFE